MQGDPENCHIFNLDKFIPGFLDFLAENIGLENNSFYIWGQERYVFGLKNTYPINWVNDSQGVASLVTAMKNSKRIFLHGLFGREGIEILFKEKEALKKCFWILWGGDLYQYRNALVTPTMRIYEAKRRVVIKNLAYIITGTSGDFDLAVDVYKTSATYINRHIYPSNYGHEVYQPWGTSTNGRVNVLVGNSATPENRHELAFSRLQPYRDELNLYCPLSYGIDSYREKIKDLGFRIFRSNFHAMTEFLPFERYIEFLKEIDIGYFANNRQQAAGNITKLIGFGKKVYAPQNLTHVQWLRSLGVFIYDYEKFSLSRIDDEISTRNHSILKSQLSFAMLKRDLIACLKA